MIDVLTDQSDRFNMYPSSKQMRLKGPRYNPTNWIRDATGRLVLLDNGKALRGEFFSQKFHRTMQDTDHEIERQLLYFYSRETPEGSTALTAAQQAEAAAAKMTPLPVSRETMEALSELMTNAGGFEKHFLQAYPMLSENKEVVDAVSVLDRRAGLLLRLYNTSPKEYTEAYKAAAEKAAEEKAAAEKAQKKTEEAQKKAASGAWAPNPTGSASDISEHCAERDPMPMKGMRPPEVVFVYGRLVYHALMWLCSAADRFTSSSSGTRRSISS